MNYQHTEDKEFRLVIKDYEDNYDDEHVSLSSSSSSSSSSSVAFASMFLCRICHEEEEQSTSCMEAPCACSGTLKFAHRECIQRWCDEKGSTLCEICLQNFEPAYTVPEKKALVEVAVTIRESLEVPRLNYDPENPEFVGDDPEDSNVVAECAPPSRRNAAWCRSVAVMFTAILLVRHFLAVVSVGADQYAFAVLTVFLLRASGILLPCYLVLKFISAIQQAQQQNYARYNSLIQDGSSSNEGEEDGVLQHEQHAVEIQSR